MKNFTDTGFEVIEDWLTDQELKLCLDDYNRSKLSADSNDQITYASEDLLRLIKPKIEQVCQLTGLNVDLLLFGLYVDTSWVNWDWHQDHESFYTIQQHKNYLNLYVILSKEDTTMSGLSMVPMNVIENLPEEIKNKIINQGANVFFPDTDKTLVKSDETGETFFLPIDIREVSVSPITKAKDLLVMRGDVIHKTQDTTKQRTALSIRCTQGDAAISRTKLLSGCETKKALIKQNQKPYIKILEKLKNLKSVTARDVYTTYT